MAPYYEGDDLELGNIPLPAYIDVRAAIADAADEIDSYIGFAYKTPVNIDEGSPVARPARLLLKRVNRALASGRTIMKLAAAQQDNEIHAYGAVLVAEALKSLELIRSGQIKLEGAVPPDGANTSEPAIVFLTKDPESQVDAFYDRIVNPNYFFSPDVVRRGAGG